VTARRYAAPRSSAAVRAWLMARSSTGWPPVVAAAGLLAQRAPRRGARIGMLPLGQGLSKAAVASPVAAGASGDRILAAAAGPMLHIIWIAAKLQTLLTHC